MARHAAAATSTSDGGTGKPFDYIILETSGLADPGNLVPLFWVDEGLGSSLYLDGVVCLVDAGNVFRSLDEPKREERSNTNAMGEEAEERGCAELGASHETVAHLQLSGADVVVLNKCDMVEDDVLEAVEQRIRSINGLAKVLKTKFGRIPQLESFLLDLHAYDGVDALNMQQQQRAHSHLDPVSFHFRFCRCLLGLVVPVMTELIHCTCYRPYPPSPSLYQSSRRNSSQTSRPGYALSCGRSGFQPYLPIPITLPHQHLRLTTSISRSTGPKAESCLLTER